MEFKLRPWQLADLESLVKHANNVNIARFMMDQFPHPYAEENGRAFIDWANSHQPARLFAIEVEGTAVGGIGVHPLTDISRKNAELGYWLSEKFWGKGIMSQAIRQMISYSFQNFEIQRLFARPFGTNLASQKILEKNGFVLEASIKNGFYKNGEFVDELIYAVRRK
jgi:ribosomal-protein-alanine N-acetyltransferase